MLRRSVIVVLASMPFLAGASHMRYRRFLAYNAAGGIIWGTAAVLLGFLAGNSYAAIEKTFGRVVAVVAAVLVVAGLIIWRVRRQRHERATDLAADTKAQEHGDEHDA